MNRKQKRELHQRQSTRQLMGIAHITPHGIRTETGERVFYLIRPDNLSVLSPEVIRSRIRSLTVLLSTQPSLELLALDSRESFQQNKEYYRHRLEEETAPEVRALLERDLAHLDAIQFASASSREFVLVLPVDRKAGVDEATLRQLEKTICDHGLCVKLAEEHQADVTMFCFWYYNVDKQKKIPNPLEEGFVGNGEEFFHRFLIKTIDKEVFHAPWNKLIKRELLADNQIEFDTRYCIYEDACFVAELLSKAQKIVVNQEMYYQYNVRSAGTLITSFRENFFESVTQLYRNAMAYCAQYRDNEPQVERFSRMYTGLVIMHLKQISCRKELGREDRKRLIDKICGSAEFMEALDKSGIRGRKRLICMLLRKRRYRTMVFLYRVLNKLQGN